MAHGPVSSYARSMDQKLLAWGLRQRGRYPALWLFTDLARFPDPLVSVGQLPRRRAGVVFRHDSDPDRAALAGRIARLCRARGLSLVVAGDIRLALRLGAGVHLRGGRWPSPLRVKGLVTSSAHSATELRRAAQAGARIVFLSPTFATASHAGAAGLGSVRWARLAKLAPTRMTIAALGGIDGRSIRRLPSRLCCAAGAIGALSIGEGRA
jgi:thiamine-phosphate pyrophosphorylase